MLIHPWSHQVYLIIMNQSRVDKKNLLCTKRNLKWRRNDIYKIPSATELATGVVWRANLMDPQQTLLPALTLAESNCITLSPYTTRNAKSYITAYKANCFWDFEIFSHGSNLTTNFENLDMLHKNVDILQLYRKWIYCKEMWIY